jgi:hypothetical protein
MRTSIVLYTVVVALITSVAQAEKPSRPPRPKNGGAQVMFVLAASAMIHCETGHWPASMEEILAYRKRTRFRMDLKIQEEWLLSSHVRLTVEPSFRFRARDYIERKYVIVDATQSPPKCESGNIEIVGANMHLGPDGEL